MKIALHLILLLLNSSAYTIIASSGQKLVTTLDSSMPSLRMSEGDKKRDRVYGLSSEFPHFKKMKNVHKGTSQESSVYRAHDCVAKAYHLFQQLSKCIRWF